MSHKASGGFSGEFPGQLDSRYSYYLKRIARLDERVVARTSGKHTFDSYRNLTENEYWCDGQDCVKEGFADRVVVASCNATLTGTESVSVDKFFLMGKSIEIIAVMDKCPLNTNALKYEIFVDGEPLFKSAKTKSTWFDWSITDPRPTVISNEMIFEITKKVNDSIKKYQTKEVIKGY